MNGAKAHGFSGWFFLRVTRRGKEDFLHDLRSGGAVRVLRPVFRAKGEPLTLHWLEQGAGLLGGDVRRLRVWLERGASLRLAPVSAQLLLPGRGRVARELWQVHLDPGARLHLMAKPTIPYPQSCTDRVVRIRVVGDVHLFWEEILLVGRLAHGERFYMERYRGRLSVRDEQGALVAAEATELPLPVPAGHLGLWGEAEGLWTGLVMLPPPLLMQARQRLLNLSCHGMCGVTELSGGRAIAVRALGREEVLTRLQEEARARLRPFLWG